MPDSLSSPESHVHMFHVFMQLIPSADVRRYQAGNRCVPDVFYVSMETKHHGGFIWVIADSAFFPFHTGNVGNSNWMERQEEKRRKGGCERRDEEEMMRR